MKSRWIIAAAAALALALLTLPSLPWLHRGTERLDSTAGSNAAASPAATAPAGGQTCDATGAAKYDFILKDQHNVPVKMADYKGKVVLLNFWATWCGPCKLEIPEFVELYDQYKDKGLVIVGISIDDTADQLQAFTKEWHMQYPVLQMHPDVENYYGPFYGIPMSFLVARDGSICVKHIGPATKTQFEQEIKALL